jgi:hypothetical protein
MPTIGEVAFFNRKFRYLFVQEKNPTLLKLYYMAMVDTDHNKSTFGNLYEFIEL